MLATAKCPNPDCMAVNIPADQVLCERCNTRIIKHVKMEINLVEVLLLLLLISLLCLLTISVVLRFTSKKTNSKEPSIKYEKDYKPTEVLFT